MPKKKKPSKEAVAAEAEITIQLNMLMHGHSLDEGVVASIIDRHFAKKIKRGSIFEGMVDSLSSSAPYCVYEATGQERPCEACEEFVSVNEEGYCAECMAKFEKEEEARSG